MMIDRFQQIQGPIEKSYAPSVLKTKGRIC